MAATQRPATQEALTEPSGERPLWKARAVVVPDRRGGPHHPRRSPALHGRARRRAADGRDRGRVARHHRLAPHDATVHPILEAALRVAPESNPREGASYVRHQATHAPIVLEPASQAFVEATANPPFLYELTPTRRARCSTTSRPRRSTSCPSTSAGSPCRPTSATSGADRPPGRRPGHAARDPVHARRRLGARQRRHPRPARARAGAWAPAPRSRSSSTTARPRPGIRSRSSRATRPPGGSSARAPRTGSTPSGWPIAGDSVGGNMTAALTLMAPRPRRRALRPPVHVLPGHRRGDGHRLLRAVRGGLLPHRQGDGVVLGLLPPGPRATREPFASPLRPATSSSPDCRRRCDRRRGRRAARRGRGVREPPARGGRGDHDRPLRRHHARLHDAQPAQRDAATRAAVAQAIATLRQALHTA